MIEDILTSYKSFHYDRYHSLIESALKESTRKPGGQRKSSGCVTPTIELAHPLPLICPLGYEDSSVYFLLGVTILHIVAMVDYLFTDIGVSHELLTTR